MKTNSRKLKKEQINLYADVIRSANKKKTATSSYKMADLKNEFLKKYGTHKIESKSESQNQNSRISHSNYNSTGIKEESKEIKIEKKKFKTAKIELLTVETPPPKRNNIKKNTEESNISMKDKLVQKILFKKNKNEVQNKNAKLQEKNNINNTYDSKDVQRSPGDNKISEKSKKKELISLAAIDVIEKEDKKNVVIILQQKEESIWAKIFGFLNPFKCGAN